MKTITIKRLSIFLLVASSWVFAQQDRKVRVSQEAGAGPLFEGPGPVTVGVGGAFENASGTPVEGAPYSASIKNESVQTLADGNRIVHNSTGTVARDSQGRTRQDTMLPAIGNLSAAHAPHLIFIHDPVAQTSYTLNLTDKTAHRLPPIPPTPVGATGPASSDNRFTRLFLPALGL